MNKEELNCYYQSNIKTSRNEDSVYAMKYASQQMLIDKLEHNWNELKKWLEEQDIFITELPVFMKEIAIEHKTMSLCYKNILDKMTELERGSDEYTSN